MYEYAKIETPFNRDENGSKKLIIGSYRNELVEYLVSLGCNWYGTEKVDGTNVRVIWDGHNVTFSGRTDNSQLPSHLWKKLDEIFGTNEAEEMFEQKFGNKRVILYGEGYGAKIQKGGGDYIKDGCNFVLFDVYFPDENIWLLRPGIEDVAMSFGVRTIPSVFYGSLGEAINYVQKRPISAIAESDTKEMEGIVLKPEVEMFDRRGNRVIIKVKVCDFA